MLMGTHVAHTAGKSASARQANMKATFLLVVPRLQKAQTGTLQEARIFVVVLRVCCGKCVPPAPTLRVPFRMFDILEERLGMPTLFRALLSGGSPSLVHGLLCSAACGAGGSAIRRKNVRS